MMHTRYQMQALDNQPIWRMHNTSVTVGTGAGIGSFYLLGRYVPKLKFPVNVVPPLVLFYFTYRAAQVQQMPGMYASILSLPTQLGSKGREVLTALRNGSHLPSQEFANMKPPPGPGQPGSAETAVMPAIDDAPPVQQLFQPDQGLSSGAFQPPERDRFGKATPRPALIPEPAPAPTADPWGQDGSITAAGAAPGSLAPPAWEGGDGWGSEESKPEPKQRSSWEEIRARQAAAAANK